MNKTILKTSIAAIIIGMTACKSKSTDNSDKDSLKTDTSKVVNKQIAQSNHATKIDSLKDNIQGTWTFKDDKDIKLVFTKDSCFHYTEGTVREKDIYTIALTSPVCDINQSQSPNIFYLTFISAQDMHPSCMEINEITKHDFSYTIVGSTGNELFEYTK